MRPLECGAWSCVSILTAESDPERSPPRDAALLLRFWKQRDAGTGASDTAGRKAAPADCWPCCGAMLVRRRAICAFMAAALCSGRSSPACADRLSARSQINY